MGKESRCRRADEPGDHRGRGARAPADRDSLKHATTALWKADNFGDGLYTFSIGLGTRISEHLQLSVDLLDTFKNRPPTAATEKNDVALVTAITAKF